MKKKEIDLTIAITLLGIMFTLEITILAKIMDKLNLDLPWLILYFIIGYIGIAYIVYRIRVIFNKKIDLSLKFQE